MMASRKGERCNDGVDWRYFLASLFAQCKAKWKVISQDRYFWRAVRFMLPLILLTWLIVITKYLNLEAWRDTVGKALVFASFVIMGLLFVSLVLSFIQRYGWQGLMFWKAIYFTFAAILIASVWTIFALFEGYKIEWRDLLLWFFFSSLAAWFGIMMHLFIRLVVN